MKEDRVEEKEQPEEVKQEGMRVKTGIKAGPDAENGPNPEP